MTTTDEQIEATRRSAQTHVCPFCGADAGQPCRSRTTGRTKDWPHSRRIDAATPVEKRYQPTYLDALCCICGDPRTIHPDYYRRNDPNYHGGELGKANGWQDTQTLKCTACGTQTRHAVLNAPDSRDYVAIRQRLALGDDNTGLKWSPEYVATWQREYRQMPFPRNPHLTHRWWVSDAKNAVAAGEGTVQALCGEPVELRDDYTPSSGKQGNDLIAPARLADDPIELEDPDTGLWWVDMDCVDCLRVVNEYRLDNQRAALKVRLLDVIREADGFGVGRIEELMRALGGTE